MIIFPVALRLRYPLLRKPDDRAWDWIENAVRRRVYLHTRSQVMPLKDLISDQIERQIEQEIGEHLV